MIWLWNELTRLGESGFLLPVGALIFLWLGLRRCYAVSLKWALLFGFGICLVVLSKVLFFGWGLGVRAIDFTGVSGHTMLAASIFPVLAWLLFSGVSMRAQRIALAVALLLALAVAVSRIELGAHSVSETVAGFVLGCLVSFPLLWPGPAPKRAVLPAWLAALALAASLSTTFAHHVQSHHLIVEIALRVSGHTHAYRRDDWLAHPDHVQT